MNYLKLIMIWDKILNDKEIKWCTSKYKKYLNLFKIIKNPSPLFDP